MNWNDLTLSDKARMIDLAVKSGITDLNTIQQVYNTFAKGGQKENKLINRINSTSKANFVKRLKDPNRQSISYGNGIATHRMAYATDDDGAIVYPEVQEIDGKLVNFGAVPYSHEAALDSAIEHRDTLRMSVPEAEWFTKNYKKYYPKGSTFTSGGPINKFDIGGPLEEDFIDPSEPYVPSDDIKNYIKSTEAFRDKWYTDGNGIPTVGYGFTGKKVKELYPDGMTREQADAYFEDLVSRSARRMIELTPNSSRLTQNQKDALLSYFYNIGEGNYSTGSPKMQQALKDLNLEEAVKNIDAGYNDKKNPGLRKRRDYERSLFEKDIVYPLQPIPPDRSVKMYFNPEITRTRVLVPYNEINTETFNPLMYSLTKRK